MELVMLMGIPGSGKSTLYRQRFEDRFLRLSKDQLGGKNARQRELLLFYAGLAGLTKMVVDAVNATTYERGLYIGPAKASGYTVTGVQIYCPPGVALERNAQRGGKARVPDKALLGFIGRWERPTLEEGFDELIFLDENFQEIPEPDYKPFPREDQP